MKSIFKYSGLALVLFLIGFIIARNTSVDVKTFKRSQIILGTVVEIQVRHANEKTADDAMSHAFSEIRRIDNLFTTYGNSPVSQMNQSRDSVFHLDEEIFELMMLCDSLWRISDAGFDVAIESLIKAWKFDTNEPDVPSREELSAALSQCGWDKLLLVPDERKIIRKHYAGINFGAIAKGYAVDRAVKVLNNHGMDNAFVNAGGEIKVIGTGWLAGIQHPRTPNSVIRKIKLDDISVATSGDYENYFEKDGIRYHHILNPFTGFPSNELQSVTVIHENNAIADGLATAVFVMGKVKGLALIESLNNTEAMIINEEGKIFYSSGFEKFLIN